MLALYRERLLDMRTRLSNELRWQLHDIWSDWEIPAKALTQPGWQLKVNRRLARAEQTVQVVIARDMIRRISELSRSTKDLYQQIAALVVEVAPQLLAEPGIGVLLAAKFIGEIAGIKRFTTDARLAGCAPIPVSSRRTDRYRLDPGGNRRLNSAFYMLAIIRIRTDPRTAVYLQKQRSTGKTKKEAIRSLKRHLVRRVYHLLSDPQSVPTTICLTYRYENPGAEAIGCPGRRLASLVTGGLGLSVGERRSGRPEFASWAASPLT
jgi:transposase